MLGDIKALTFDTGGTVLDWHSGFRDALRKAGEAHGLTHDWAKLANQLRRYSITMMRDAANRPTNFDAAHAAALDKLIEEQGLLFTRQERHRIAYGAVHSFSTWADVPAALAKLRNRFLCVSLTILSYRIVMDTARANGLHWDAVLSCEGMSAYKPDPDVYRDAARYLQLDPSEICMIAAHNFDLDAARSVGFRTIFVRRPLEWGPERAPDPIPNPDCDLIVDDFTKLNVVLSQKGTPLEQAL